MKHDQTKAIRRRRDLEWVASLPVGTFAGIPVVQWVSPDNFLYIPHPSDPLRFYRANGERIQPEAMFTDGGSVRSILQPIAGVTRWSHGSAWLIHDWDFDAHHLGISTRTFEEVNLTLAEAMRTLQVAGIVQDRPDDILNTYQAVSSAFGRAVWDQPLLGEKHPVLVSIAGRQDGNDAVATLAG